jgi:hypothetical protein
MTGKEGVCGRALWRKREGERERGRERERKRKSEREKEGEGERDVEYVQNCLFLKRNYRCLGTS